MNRESIAILHVLEVVQRGVVAPAVRCVQRRGHPSIPAARPLPSGESSTSGGARGLAPLSHEVSAPVDAPALQHGRQARHVARDAGAGCLRVRERQRHVHRQPPRLHTSPRGSANIVHV